METAGFARSSGNSASSPSSTSPFSDQELEENRLIREERIAKRRRS
jgi:hypothetical protein